MSSCVLNNNKVTFTQQDNIYYNIKTSYSIVPILKFKQPFIFLEYTMYDETSGEVSLESKIM